MLSAKARRARRLMPFDLNDIVIRANQTKATFTPRVTVDLHALAKATYAARNQANVRDAQGERNAAQEG